MVVSEALVIDLIINNAIASVPSYKGCQLVDSGIVAVS